MRVMRCCGLGSRRWRGWSGNSEKVERVAVVLIYGQIGCSLLGSLSPLYNGVLILHLGVSLFGLVAVESSNQSLARTYAFLLFCSFFLDLSWFFLFSHHIWHFPAGVYGSFASYAVRLTLVVQIVGVSLRLLSSFLWIQMYRLGVSSTDTSSDFRNSFLKHDEAEASMYDPANFLPLFRERDRTTTTTTRLDDASRYGAIPNGDASVGDSASAAETSRTTSSKF
ncbi:hypothetical protein C2S52_017524 [Perilla frutescens var. hirtella]|nr:hypothetical protein C2S52_017524 [Perilla frutescens var. hirtella]KAH6811302.1 hypothetical protein C2S51_025064 [Perilla frutescens var. frutescens]